MIPLDAKSRFQQNKTLAGKHAERMADPDFRVALDAALQHFSDMETRNHSGDPTIAAASFHRIAGSREFAGVLLNLSEVFVAPPAKKTGLDYSA